MRNLLIAARCVALGLAIHAAGLSKAEAQTPSGASGSGAVLSELTRALIRNASYWRSRGEPKAALEALGRVLIYAPNEPDVLAAAAELAFQVGDYDGAVKLRERLERVAPSDPRLPTLAAARQLDSGQQAHLARARELTRLGNNAEAVAEYKQLFRGEVIPTLAVEYYGVLALTTSEGFDEANQQLGLMAERTPDDTQLQLSYARLLVLQEDTRADGIKLLIDLTKQPGVDKAARQVWRDALLWQGPSERALNQLDAYLHDNPNDPAIKVKRAEFTATLPDASTKALMRGYVAMSVKNSAAAELAFKDALRLGPDNANAAFMLAMFKRSQGKESDAQLLIKRAIELAPERRDELIAASGGEYSAELSPRSQEQIAVSVLYATGKYDEAEQALLKLSAGHETASTWIQLGEIQLRARQLDEAQASFAKARGLAPRSADVACGEAKVMALRARYDEATALYSEAAELYAKARNPNGARRVATGRAELLRARTARLDAGASAREYETSLAADPRNMAMRVDYSRILRQAGDAKRAWSILGKGLELNHDDHASLWLALDAVLQADDRQHAMELSRRLMAGSQVAAEKVLPVKAAVRPAHGIGSRVSVAAASRS